MSDFVMPMLGADMEDGTFVEWRVAAGDPVARGDIVCVVETQKGAVDVEIWQTGVVAELLARPGDRIPVGGLLARIDAATSAAPTPSESGAASAARQAQPTPVAAESARDDSHDSDDDRAFARPPLPGSATSRTRISPAARRRARELDLDPSRLDAPTDGRPLRIADVERIAAGRAHGTSPGAKTVVPAQGEIGASAPDVRQRMRDAIGAAMSRSNREIPHYYLSARVCVEATLAWLERYNAERPVSERVLFAALQLKAVAAALREAPDLNGWYLNDHFRMSPDVHPGVAIALRGGGLVAPALQDAGHHSLPELMAALRDLLTRARAGQLRSSELSNATITVTNLGDLGVETVFGMIYPPQVALVGFGCVSAQACVVDGAVVAARCVDVSLAADHRVSDGMRGARFLGALRRLLEDPANWRVA